MFVNLNHTNMKNIQLFVILIALLLSSCAPKQDKGVYLKIQGFTQGTTYVITYQTPDSANLHTVVDSILHEFDLSLSTYIPNSIISKINNNDSLVIPDEKFIAVWEESVRINELSGGAFDITVGPLINAWGFGPGMQLEMDSMVIDSLMNYVGMEKLSIEDGRIVKKYPEIRMDVDAIAQGYSVDVLTDYMKEIGLKNFLINVGGEIRCAGVNPAGTDWKVGVDKPIFGSALPGQELQAVLKLKDISLASSGNYRKFYEVDGKKIVHTLDPATGYTKMSQLLGATIISESCMTADALATACMVMGPEKAKEFISGLEDVEAYFITTDEDGLYMEWYTPGMEDLIQK
jgi:FAD:protein FMN transferase